jgi:hypothetical protein
MARAKKEAAEVVEQPAAEPVIVFGFDVAEFLRRVGVDLAQIEGQARAWADAHPGQALPLEVAIAFVESELGPAQVGAAVRLVASGLVELVQTGKGPVQHAGSELA